MQITVINKTYPAEQYTYTSVNELIKAAPNLGNTFQEIIENLVNIEHKIIIE